MARTLRNKLALTNFAGFLTSSSPIPALYHSTRLIGTLAFEEVRSEKPTNFSAFILHGVLGSGRNWRSFSRILSQSLANSSPPSDWKMVLADLRNHGHSTEVAGLCPPHNMVNAAHDLANLVKSQGWAWPDVVLGHSLGGKVALQYALSCACGDYGDSAVLPKQLWILDSVPGKVIHENSDGEVEQVMQLLKTLPTAVPSRKWLVNHMLELGFSKSLAQWLGSNLKRSGEQETWVFNLDGAIEMFNSFREMDYWPLLENPPKGMEIVIVRAENSDRWHPDVIERLESLSNRTGDDESQGKLSVHLLPKSGHWVHVDNPKGLLDLAAPKISLLA